MELPIMDAGGAIYLLDNNRIRRIGTDGIINTIAGNGQSGNSGDGGPALSATLSQVSVTQLAVYGSRVCFADGQAHRIRCVDQSTGLIQGYGTGLSGTGGDGGNIANASFMSLSGLAFDNAGNWYISDFAANSVRRVDAVTGTITMFAGPGPGYCCVPVGDGGPALGADIYEPGQLAVSNGALYIADAGNNRIRRVDLSTGIIATVAGGGNSTSDGVLATSASISPAALILDAAGDLFLSTANTVRKVDTNGIITTIAGTGNSGSGLDDIPATQTTFGGITGLIWDPFANRLLIGDFEVRLRQIFFTPATTTTLTVSPNPAVPNGQVTLQASVSPQTATGSIRFYQDAVLSSTGAILQETLLGSVPLVNNTASITWNTPLTGSSGCPGQVCNLRAVYSGDAADNLSTSPDVVAVLQKGDTSTTFTSTPNPSTQGQSVTFTATVTPISATGTFFVSNGSTQIGSYPVTNGVATFTISNLPTGSNALSARYSGSFSYNPSTGTLTQVVQSSTTTTLTSSANPSIYGSAVVLTAAVSPANATGTVQFYNGATLLGSAALANGQAQWATSNLPTGSDSLTAVYSGDTNYAGSTSAVVTQTVNKQPTTVTLTSSANPVPFGQPVTFTAAISQSLATGTVQFQSDSSVLGTVAVANGAATLTLATLPIGDHSIYASYSGDSNYASSPATPLIQTISKAVTSVALTGSPNPATFGQTVTLTATVTPNTATGLVQFFELPNYGLLGTLSVSNGSASLVLSPDVYTFPVGTHTIIVNYNGDANNAFSTSSALTLTVVKVSTTTTLAAAPNPSSYGNSVTLTAAVSPASATGTVQFLDGGAVLGTASVSNGIAVLSFSSPAVGSHTLTAAYSGDSLDTASTSVALTIAVNKAASSVTLASSLNPAVAGQSVTFTAAVTPAGATGTVQFLDGATVIGSTSLSNGAAVFATSSLAGGAHSVTANYLGDGNFSPSQSAVVQQVVKYATTSTLASAPNPSIYGQTVTLTATVAPNTATGTVQFLDGATVLGTAPLSGGTSVLATAALATTIHSITAVYGGDGSYSGSTSAAVMQTVNTAPTVMTPSSSANPSTFGQPVTFTATVTPRTATGSVLFWDGNTPLATVALNFGVATLTTSSLTAGLHVIAPSYGGDANYSGSIAYFNQSVTKPTSTSLTSDKTSITYGQAVTFTATVSPSSVSGVVQFLDGTVLIGSAVLSSGQAKLGTVSLTGGTHSVTAVFAGDSTNAPSTSAPRTITVSPAKVSINLGAGPNPTSVGQTVTFTAGLNAPGMETGTFTFKDGNQVLGVVALDPTTDTAVFSTSGLSSGNHQITVVYSGDINYLPATSSPLIEKVK
jgi:hypothetical protein